MHHSPLGWLFLMVCVLLLGCGQSSPPQPNPTNAHRVPPTMRAPATHEIVSTTGGFKITFPVAPTKQAGTTPDGKPTENYFYQGSDKALLVGFSYPQIPIPQGMLNDKLIAGGLDGAATSYVNKSKGEFTKKTPIRLGDTHGLEFEATIITAIDTGATKGRVYWVDGKLVRVLAIGQPAWLQGTEVNDYFQSFAIIGTK